MDIGTLLLSLALIALVAAYLMRPLIEQRGQAVSEEDHDVSVLLAERDRILSSLQELDMDRAMGKLLAEDYERQRRELVEEGAAILRRLDERVGLKPSPETASGDRSLEVAIEAEIASLRAARSGQPEAQFCPSCGNEVLATDRFCTHCGEPLTEEVVS